jgi:hypothetical protein
LNDPRKFKAPFIPKARIWQEADRLRAEHPAGRLLPVRILDLAEFDLGLDLVPADGLGDDSRFCVPLGTDQVHEQFHPCCRVSQWVIDT